jgi:outer membrane protein OmpA-like peptidoglycan-associated protein
MKKIIILTSLIMVVVSAQDYGTSVLPLLRVGFGARAAALGESFTAGKNDGACLWWNPGSLGFTTRSEVFTTYHRWFQDFNDQYIGATYATRKGVFGLGFVYSWVGGIEEWDENNLPVGDTTGSQNTWILQLGYGKKFSPKISLGAGFKFLSDRIVNQSGTGFALDLGANLSPASKVNLGLVVKNVGPSMKYDASGIPLPTEIRLGALFGPYYNNNLFLDLSAVSRSGFLAHFGDEYWIKEILALRIGFKADHQTNKLTFGVGTRISGFHIDYTFAGYSILGSTHRIWLSKEWGELVPLGNLTLTVIDDKTLKPVPVSIVLDKPTVRTVQNDSLTGVYKLRDVPIGLIKIKVSKNKYYSKEDSAVVEADLTKTLNVKLTRIPPGTISGKILDVKTLKPVAAKIVYKGMFSGETYADTLTGGMYTIPRLEAGRYYLRVEPSLTGFIGQEDTLLVEPGALLVKNFELIKKGEVIVLKGINFETGKATLLEESFSVLDHAGKIMVDNPTLVVEIGGHSDNVRIKTPEFPNNQKLSQARANSVRDYLIKKFAIVPARLIAKGYGETQPVASNKTADGKAQNRRVEFKVLGQ